MTTVITIDKNICTGCQECTKVCPADAIEGKHGEPQVINTNKCVMCGQCVQKCKSYVSIVSHGYKAYEEVRKERGIPETVKEPLFAAYNVCHLNEVKKALADPNVITMVQCAPAVRVALAEDFGNPLGTLDAGRMATALKKIGFDYVYDTNFAADLTIMEEGTELITRVTKGGVLPMFTSCCPAWVTFLERNYPELKDHLSTCKSPMQMQGPVQKTYGAKINNIDPKKIYNVAVMPCTCKEFEALREEMQYDGMRSIETVLTTRELAWLIKDMGIDFNALEPSEFQHPLGEYTGAGQIFGVTGGVMEAAIRTGYELITGQPIPDVEVTPVRGTEGFRVAEMQVGDLVLKVGVVTGLKNVVPVLEQVKAGTLDLHFIEVMTCPVGCVSGGGQPKLLEDTDREEAYAARREATFVHDRELPIRKSHENPSIQQIYKDFFGQPNGKLSHHMLHTKYCTGENNWAKKKN